MVIKANIAWARTPEQACTNNPELFMALIKMCYQAGAKPVAVWDHTCDNYQFCFPIGYERVTQKAGADIFSGHGRNVYKPVDVPKGKKLKKAEVIRDILETDVFINFPIPKQHFATELTLGLKNFIGIVWDMEQLRRIDLHQCIADLSTIRRPDLVVMDAIRILTTNGPKGPGKTEDIGEVITSTDIVAADAYAATFFKNPKTGKPYNPRRSGSSNTPMTWEWARSTFQKSRRRRSRPHDENDPVFEKGLPGLLFRFLSWSTSFSIPRSPSI